MGKEQDLLEASRNGNYHVIEKNLMARMKKSGPLHLTSLRRLPGPNTTDPRNGFTCLHYASLNGHKDIVRILLEYGANPNVVDHNGSSPLHLASWTGDYEIVSMLISANNSNNNNGIQPNDSNNCMPSNNNNKKLYADINLKNKDNETALHSACQYGHTAVVSLLLTQGADPFVQNIRQETPLDLASQYGRLETIELLLQLRFDLLNDYLTTTVNKNNNNNNDNHHHQQQLRQHSPLHLASRNGHKSIVKLLLDLGFNVNYLTVNGTALHEAVMCGKNEVVRMLLEAGTDIRLCNDRGQKVQQLIDGLNTSVAKQTRKLLREHMQRINDFNLANNGNYDNDDEEETMDRNELISPMSESTASHISNANNTNSHDGLYNNNNSQIIYGDHSQSEDQDLTIVDSMLNDEMNAFYNHFETANNDNQQDFDDLIMDDDDEDGTDIQCISPPPGYTDGDHINDDDHNNDSCHINPINPERIDCVSPSSSLFSTSIFSELASIFDEHLVNPPKNSTESKNNNLNQSSINGGSSMELHSSNQIKSSNSFTNDNEELIFRSTTFNQKFFNEGNNEKDPLHHHQSFNDVYCRDSPSRRMTTPNIMIGAVSSSSNIPAQNDNQAMMLIQSNQNHNNINNNNDSMTISSSNYSISSSVSSTTNMNNKHAMKIQPPLKPPRKSIDSKKVLKSKSIDQCSFVSSGLKIIDIQNDKPASLQLQNNRDDSRSSDLNDSSDHSTSQNMNSVISKKENEKTNRKQSSNKILKGINNNEKRNDNYNNSSLLSSTTHHSIDDFYLLYDQAAREEHEKEKINNHNQDHRLSMTNTQLNDQQQKQSTIREKAEQNNEPLMNSHNNNNNDDNDENISYGTNNDPPSPNSAETEIIHAIEPLKQQFYGNDNTSILLKITNNSISFEPKRTKRRKKAGQISKVNCQHHQPHEYRDNWTLTTQNDDQIIDENASNDNKKSIGIYVHLENVDKNAKLITKCGIDDHHQQQQPHHHHQHRNRSHNKNDSKRQQHQHQQQPTKQISDKQIQKQTATNVDQQKQSTNDYYSAYCETLKFDKKGEKENPFAGLCRGGLTPAKSVNNARTVAAGQSPQSQLLSSSGTNRTIEKKKKIVELSETRKSLRKQRSILSGGRAESMNKLNNNNHNGKLSVFNEDDKKSKSIDQRSSSTTLTGAMITQPNNIYATLRKKKKSKSFNGDNNAKLSAIDIDECCGEQNNGNDNKKYSTDKNDRSMNSNSILQDQSQQIFLWLKEIDMQEYKDILIRNGYDDLDFMDNNVMDDNDLIEIGIIQALHRDAILRAAQSLPYRTPKLTRDQLQKFSIEEWLSFIHLKQYVDIFKNNGLTELRKIRNIWEVELETMLEIDKCGHRRRILYSLSDFNQRDSMIVSDNSDALSPWLSTDNASTCTQNDRGRDKNDHQQQPQQQQSQWKGWKHARHELINGECQYLVNYLGSTLVRELRGIDSTRASIGKLKSSNMIDDGKISKILLSISCQGVQFQDSKTNRLICEHEIRNIHCICQDSEDLNYFAYITKDFETNNHYCHVFMSTQTDLVTEIILTLGQAFEIAYQIVLEQYNIHVKQQQQQHQTSTIKSCPANNVQNLSNTSTVKELENSSPPSSSSHNNNDNNCPDLNNQLNTTFVKVDQPQKSNSNVDNVIESSNNDNNNNKNSTKPSSPPPPPPQEKQFQELLFEQSNNLNKNKHIEEEIRLISPQPPLSSSPFIKMDQDLQQQQQQQPNKSKSINDDDDEIIAVGEQQQQQQQQQPQQEQLYAIVDKSRKNKITKLPFNNNLTQYQQSTSENDKENRPIPPIRSSSTASSNSSTGTRSDSRQQQLQQHQQQQQKPKPPVRVQSMQNQQKPEVSPKPKNLLNKSNTVTSSTTISLASASASVSTNLKPVLARYQPQLMLSTFQQQQQPQQQKLNEHRTITNHSIINSLPSPSSSSQSSMIKANQNNQMMI